MKKVVTIGGGTGLSHLIKELKNFPIDITAIIAVSDDGSSTGKLREEFMMPAVGDIRKVLSNLSTLPDDIKSIMEYRFNTYSDLDGHPLGNLVLTAFYNKTGSLSESIEKMSRILSVKHKILALSEDYLTLVAEDVEGNVIKGENNICHLDNDIKRIYYEEDIKVNKDALKAIAEADLIIFSMGSLYTSLLPNLIADEMKDAIKKSKAKVLYVCNAVNEPNETHNFKVSDFIKTIEEFLGYKKINAIVHANTKIPKNILDKYKKEEEKTLVELDRKEVEDMGVDIIDEDVLMIEDDTIRHDSLKLAVHIFYYLMK